MSGVSGSDFNSYWSASAPTNYQLATIQAHAWTSICALADLNIDRLREQIEKETRCGKTTTPGTLSVKTTFTYEVQGDDDAFHKAMISAFYAKTALHFAESYGAIATSTWICALEAKVLTYPEAHPVADTVTVEVELGATDLVNKLLDTYDGGGYDITP